MQSPESKSLGVIGYTFPEDKRQTVKTFRELPFDVLAKLKSVYEHEYQFGLDRMNELLDSVVFSVCRVCDEEQAAYGELPEHWGWYTPRTPNEKPFIMCDKCEFRWTEKYNESPNLKRELDD